MTWITAVQVVILEQLCEIRGFVSLCPNQQKKKKKGKSSCYTSQENKNHLQADFLHAHPDALDDLEDCWPADHEDEESQ